MPHNSASSTLGLLSLFAISMALLEAVVVIYMRQLYYPDQPLDLFPLHFLTQYDPRVELSREFSTIAMIIAVALLAERENLTRRFAAFVFVFGLWDLFYYVWLKVLLGWPRGWLEWDVLFLIPTIWLGPWICPAAIGAMFVVWGTAVLASGRELAFTGRPLWLFVTGALLGLMTFMQPAVSVTLRAGSEALVDYVPSQFWWWLFLPAYGLMAFGLFASLRSRRVTVAIG